MGSFNEDNLLIRYLPVLFSIGPIGDNDPLRQQWHQRLYAYERKQPVFSDLHI